MGAQTKRRAKGAHKLMRMGRGDDDTLWVEKAVAPRNQAATEAATAFACNLLVLMVVSSLFVATLVLTDAANRLYYHLNGRDYSGPAHAAQLASQRADVARVRSQDAGPLFVVSPADADDATLETGLY